MLFTCQLCAVASLQMQLLVLMSDVLHSATLRAPLQHACMHLRPAPLLHTLQLLVKLAAVAVWHF
jgi:hypothetical protein